MSLQIKYAVHTRTDPVRYEGRLLALPRGAAHGSDQYSFAGDPRYLVYSANGLYASGERFAVIYDPQDIAGLFHSAQAIFEGVFYSGILLDPDRLLIFSHLHRGDDLAEALIGGAKEYFGNKVSELRDNICLQIIAPDLTAQAAISKVLFASDRFSPFIPPELIAHARRHAGGVSPNVLAQMLSGGIHGLLST